MEPETSTELTPVVPSKIPSSAKWLVRIAIVLSVLSLIGSTSVAIFAYRAIQELRSEIDSRTDSIDWSLHVHQAFHREDGITPEVGVIQFLGSGYSIQLEKVNYTPSGLELEGFVGNPTTLWVSQLTLDFWAYKPLYLKREEFMKEDMESRSFFLQDEIGHAQSQTIPALGPGRRAPFRVTVPNIVQTKEGFTLTVNFSGERYAYGN